MPGVWTEAPARELTARGKGDHMAKKIDELKELRRKLGNCDVQNARAELNHAKEARYRQAEWSAMMSEMCKMIVGDIDMMIVSRKTAKKKGSVL